MQKAKSQPTDMKPDDRDALMERVRGCCLTAAQAAYEDAGVRGLCTEGRWECAMDAIRALKLKDVSEEAAS